MRVNIYAEEMTDRVSDRREGNRLSEIHGPQVLSGIASHR